MPLNPIAIAAATLFALTGLAAGDGTAAPTAPVQSVMLSNTSFNLPPNTRWREERIMSAPKFKLSVELGAEKNVRGSMSMLTRQLMEIDVLTPKKLRLNFVQSDTSSDIDFGANTNRSTTTLPLDGKAVVTERDEKGRWSAKLEAKRRPTPEEGSALNALTYLWAEGIYPDKEITIGESWKVDAKDFKNLFGSEFKKPKGEFEFTLVRIDEHDGETCAKITGKGQLTSQTKSLGNATAGNTEETPLDAVMDLEIEIFHAIELGMDLDVKMTGTLVLSNDKKSEELSYEASSPVEFTRSLERRQNK